MAQLISPNKQLSIKSMFSKLEPIEDHYEPYPNIMALGTAGEHWLSQIDSIREQLKDLQNDIVTEYNVGKAKPITGISSLWMQVSSLEGTQKKLKWKVRKHLKYLNLLLNKSKIKDGIIFSKLHSRIKEEISDFVRAFDLIREKVILTKQQGFEKVENK